MNSSELLSKTISLLRFPLIVGVVFIHTNPAGSLLNTNDILAGGALALYEALRFWISDVISRIAVPLFFFFSGFLFFYKLDDFTYETYFAKLKRRTKSLLIPYIFWNIATILWKPLGSLLLPQFFAGKALRLLMEWGPMDWLQAIWSYGGMYPISIQFWFIRDLMIVVCFTPLIYFCVKKLGWLFVFVLAVMWLKNVSTPIGFSMPCWFFFSAGACLSLKKINFATCFKKWGTRLFPLYLLVTFIGVYCHKYGVRFPYFSAINILLGIYCVVGLTATCIEKGLWKIHPILIGGSFFVFSCHMLILPALDQISQIIFKPQGDLFFTMLYLALTLLTCAVGLIAYAVMLKICPTFTKIISGGRV